MDYVQDMYCNPRRPITKRVYIIVNKISPEEIRVEGLEISLRWTPHPVIVTIGDNRAYIRVLLYSCYTTITGWGVLLRYHPNNGLGPLA